jgi:hypothetical protein
MLRAYVVEYVTPQPLTVAYAYQEWDKFGELFAKYFKEANPSGKLSLLRDLLCSFRDTRAHAVVLTKCNLR